MLRVKNGAKVRVLTNFSSEEKNLANDFQKVRKNLSAGRYLTFLELYKLTCFVERC